MEREKASALPSPVSKAAKTYFANLCSLLGHAINLELPKPEFQVYIPRPASISSFNDLTLESVLDLLRFDEDDLKGYENHYGGKLLTFTSEMAATNIAKQFPVDVVVGKKTHRFHTAPPLVTFSRVRVRVMGLPCPFSNDNLRLLGQSLALSLTHLIHSEVLHSRRGKATDRGLLIFSVCPFSLLVSKTATIVGCDIQFQFQSRDAHCHMCKHSRHSLEHCYQSYEQGLPTIYFNKDGVPSFFPPPDEPADREKEKEKDNTSKAKNNNSSSLKDFLGPGSTPAATCPPPKGRGKTK